jgi:hypothetical protein
MRGRKRRLDTNYDRLLLFDQSLFHYSFYRTYYENNRGPGSYCIVMILRLVL